MKKLIQVKGNCRNDWTFEGYAEGIKQQTSKRGVPELVFKCTSFNTKMYDDITHATAIKVVLKGRQKEIVEKFLRPMMLVICEGNYQAGGVMAGQRVTPSEPHMVDWEYEFLSEEVSNADKLPA